MDYNPVFISSFINMFPTRIFIHCTVSYSTNLPLWFYHLLGTYLGYTKKSKYRVWVPNLTEVQLRIIESEASDPETLAMKLFQYIFKSELETKADDVCCTKSDGKRLLNQDYLRGIRCIIECNSYNFMCNNSCIPKHPPNQTQLVAS